MLLLILGNEWEYIFWCWDGFEGPFGLWCPRQPTTTPPRLRWWCGWVSDINVVIVGSVMVVLDLDLVMFGMLSVVEPKAQGSCSVEP